MARHDQRHAERKFVCTYCKAGTCELCTDVARVLVGLGTICDCDRPGHDGEPTRQQIADPETGTVYAPGLHVTTEGEVVRE